MKKKTTLKDIATALNVSISTVSKSLKDSPEIGQETKDKVLAYAKEHHYQPNLMALALKNSLSKHIGVIVPDLRYFFFTSVIRGVDAYANQRGYHVSIGNTEDLLDNEKSNIDFLLRNQVDGLILSLSSETELKNSFGHLRALNEVGIPVVQFDRVEDSIKGDKVVVDDLDSAYRAVKHFINKGKNKIGFISTEKHISVGRYRIEGYKKALKDSGIAVDESLIQYYPAMIIKDELIRAYLERVDIEAVLCVNEVLAVQTLRVMHEMQIPKLMVIGFTNGYLSEYSNPPLTAIDQHGEDIGRKTAQMLIERIESKRDIPDRTEIVRTTLIERESTKL